MAVLSNAEIIRALNDGRLVIEPRPQPAPEMKGSPYNATSVDLRLSSMLRIPAEASVSFTSEDRANRGETLKRVYDPHSISHGGYELKPGKFILGNTVEKVSLPIISNTTEKCLAARIEGRSSFAREGMIIHFTAPTIHSGFRGGITLEIINLGKYPIVLHSGVRICQLIVETVEGVPSQANKSQYQDQQDPVG